MKAKADMSKTAIIIALIIGVSILGYGFMDYKYKKDALEQKIKSEELIKNEEKQTELDKQEAIKQAKSDLDYCLSSADTDYDNFWYSECKGQGLLSAKCISLHETTFEEYVKKNNISQDKKLEAVKTYYKEISDCSCRLPIVNSDIITKSRETAKNECFKKYPQ